MINKKSFVILLALLLCLPMITDKAFATELFNEDIVEIRNTLEDRGSYTEFIDGSLKVDKLVIKKWEEKGYQDFLNYDYYEKGSNWESTFNYFKKADNNLRQKSRNIKSFEDEDKLYFDELFYNNLLEEVYVVDLVNANSDTKTTLDNWKYNLQFLIDNYDSIKNNKNSNMLVIDKYIEAYLPTLATEDYPDEKGVNIRSISPKSTSTYKNKVVAYIDANWNNYSNTIKYAYYQGADCANFVSQCLHEGGISMKGTPGTSSSANNTNNWFSKGNSQSSVNVSSTWRGANMFKWHWLDRTSKYKFFNGSNRPLEDYYTYGDVGDAVSITNANKAAIHTMVVYKKSFPELILAGHTSNTRTAKFIDKISQFGGGIYIFKM
ncbi:amidase domain-containing protein [Hathewaya massiliensis]|uniref:amidase domain-containing protein n=1 Tax=Hathewaya massiliensis TaxID=1964382 RepID=UPI0011575485|nr:amidase domain-containing protein [Hathewaya massiliensis]